MSGNFPVLPKAWFLLGPSRKFGKKPQAFKLYNKKFVIFRTEDGVLRAMRANCPHMGVHLANGGKVRGNCIVCPLHGWEFGTDGKCKKIPATDHIPEFANLPSFPVEERLGVAYIWNGTKADYPLPFFDGEKVEDFVSHEGVSVHQKTSWFGPVVNAFDIQHFIYSHNRIPMKESEYDLTQKYVARVKHFYKLVGKYWFEEVIKKMFGTHVELSATIWGGNVIITKSTLGKFTNWMISFCTPVEGKKASTDIVVYRKKHTGPLSWLVNKIMLPIQAELCRKIFQDESDELEEAIIRDTTLHPENDKYVAQYLAWFKACHAKDGNGCDRESSQKKDMTNLEELKNGPLVAQLKEKTVNEVLRKTLQ